MSARRRLGPLVVVLFACEEPPPPIPDTPPPTGPIAMRRLTHGEYAATVRAALGEDIRVPSRLEPDQRRAGLVAVGASQVSVTPAGFERYEAAARDIAGQAMSPEQRDRLVPCAPGPECASEVIATIGRRLLRRPLSAEETDARVRIAVDAQAALGDFHAGLEVALTSLLVAPDFVFRVERDEPSEDGRALTPRSRAERLAYFLWSAPPDDALLDAAEARDLSGQVERMLASPRIEDGVRAFFSDLLELDRLDEAVRKDTTLFPAFSRKLMASARTQTLDTIADHLVTRSGDYRALFTTRETFIDRALGVVHRVPVAAVEGFERHTTGQRVGLLGHVSLLALHAHAGRSSPTLRGRFVRQVLLCQTVPEPPPDIDFSIIEDTAGPLRTARERLSTHATSAACSGCHALMDPIGLGLERFDALGARRATENGVTIDPSGELDGRPFADATELGAAVAAHHDLGPCLVRHLYRYAVGREETGAEEPLLEALAEHFALREFQVPALMGVIARSDGFRRSGGSP